MKKVNEFEPMSFEEYSRHEYAARKKAEHQESYFSCANRLRNFLLDMFEEFIDAHIEHFEGESPEAWEDFCESPIGLALTNPGAETLNELELLDFHLEKISGIIDLFNQALEQVQEEKNQLVAKARE